jgi:hypothetical protein
MKKITLLFSVLFSILFVESFGQAPTVAASGVTTIGQTTSSISISWTSGNGSKRLVTCALSTSSVALPANGVTYAASSTYGSGTNLGSGNYAVYNSTGSSCTINGLAAGTAYRIRIYEYNTTFGTEYYLTSSYPNYLEYSLATQPTVQIPSISVGNIAPTTASISFAGSNGTYRLAAVRASSSYANVPVDGTAYYATPTYGSGSAITGTSPYPYVVFGSTGTGSNLTNLSPGTTYTAAAFAYNGSSGDANYLTTGYPTVTFTTWAAEPTSASSALSFSNITHNSMTVSWTTPSSGGGVYRIVTCKPGTTNSDLPVDATAYSASSFYGSGAQLPGGAYVVYNGTGSYVNVSGLSTATSYAFSVFEYNQSTNTYNNTHNYLTSGYATGNQSTLDVEPTVASTGLSFSGITSNSVTASWSNGNGAGRVVGVRAGRVQTALNFDGVNDYVSIPNESNFDFTNSMTAEAWIKVNSFSVAYQSVITKGDNSWRIQRYSTTNVLEFTCVIGGVNKTVIGSRSVNDGKWHHIAGTYNGSQMTLYIDGTVDGYLATTGNIDNSAYAVYIGENAQMTGRYFNGQIDEVRLWNAALSTSTLRNQMNKTLIGNEYGLKGYWKLDDGFTTTSTANNSSLTASINGTLAGFTTTAATGFTSTSGWVYSGAPVDTPRDFDFYYGLPTYMGSTAYYYYYGGGNTFVVMVSAAGTSITATNLSPNTYYNFSVFEYNGNYPTINYLTNSYLTGDVLTLSVSAPSITSFTPASGTTGTVVTINGTGFNATASLNTVYFGAEKATVLTANGGGTQLTVQVPVGANHNLISVTNNTLTAYSVKPFVLTSSCGGSAITASSYNAPTSNTQYSYAGDVHMLDVDIDGKPDLVGLNTNYYLQVSRNTSTGSVLTFASPSTFYNYYSTYNQLAIADFDGDGKVDFALTNDYNVPSVQVLKNQSSAGSIYITQATEVAGTPSYSISDIAVADFDRDGKPDIIISYYGNLVSVFRNTSSIGNISFATKADYSGAASSVFMKIAIADIDGDGKLDVALAGGGANSISYLRNTSTVGSISFPVATSTALSSTVNSVAIGDIDNDTKPDLVLGYGSNNIALLKNNSTIGTISILASPTTVAALANTVSDVQLADIDGDGKLDIVAGYNSGTQVSVYKNNSTATFSIAAKVDFTISGGYTSPKNIAIGDLNGDSKADMASSTNNTAYSVFQNNINPLAGEPTTSASALNFSGTTTSQTTLTFTAGNGGNRLVVARLASAAAVAPVDGANYVPNTVFGSGTDLGAGNYCVYNGNSNSVPVTGLQSNTSYTFVVYEYNGSQPCENNYLIGGTGSMASVTTNNNPPTLNAISNPASICQSSGLQTVSLSGISTGGETQTLTVTATSSNTGLIPHPTVTYTSPSATGSLSYTPVAGVSGTSIITVTVNDGATNNNITTRTFTVTVDALPTTANAGAAQQICPSVGTLAGNTPLVGTGTWTILFTTNGAITLTSATNPNTTVNNFNINDSIYLRWRITNGACASSNSFTSVKRKNCPTTADFTVDVNTACLSGSPVVTFTDASFVSGATIISWNWNFGAGAFPPTATGQGPHVVVYSTAGAKTAALTVNDNLGANDAEIKVGFININDVPEPAGNVSGTSTVCQGQTGVTYSVPVINGATGYTWNLPSGASIVSGINTNNITVDYGTGALSGNISVRGTNACGNGTVSANFSVTVNPLPAAAGSIAGNISVCEGTSGVSYSIAPVTNATSYVWNITGGASITTGAGTNVITANYPLGGVANGTVTVHATNACGSGASSLLNVAIDSMPGSAASIIGQTVITSCPSTLGVTYSIPMVNHATAYNWTLPSGVNISSGAGTNTITVDYSPTAVSGNITVTPVNSCGSGASSQLAVSVNTLPDIAGAIAGMDSLTVCPASNGVTYSVASIFNADYYVWTIPAGSSIVSGDSTNVITVNFGAASQSGTITVYGENACGTGTSSAINVFISSLPTQELCMVTVDDNSQHNKIIWEKPITTEIDSFRIYREITTSFVHIASVAYDSLSEYVDDTFVPLANPNTTNFRYKISAVDTCGNEGPLSNYHRTIFLQANQGVGNVINLNWVPYEGATVTYYRILRDTLGTGVFEVIDSVPGANTVYTDLNPPLSQTSVKYVLESNWATSCDPTRATINTTRSNIKSAAFSVGIVENTILNNQVVVYPNPATDQLTIQYPLGFKKYNLMLFDALGQMVYSEQLNGDGLNGGTSTKQIDISNFAKGIYIVSLQTEYGSTFKRLVIQ